MYHFIRVVLESMAEYKSLYVDDILAVMYSDFNAARIKMDTIEHKIDNCLVLNAKVKSMSQLN